MPAWTGTGTEIPGASNPYAVKADVKARLGISVTTHDDILDNLIDIASRAIDADTDRVFYTEDDTRYFDGNGKSELLLPYDLLTVTTLLEYDSDGVLSVTWTSGVANYYVLEPYNESPKWKIRAVQGYQFTAGVKNFAITGRWGYAVGVPEMIEHACINRTITMFNRLRDGEVTVQQVRNGEVSRTFFDPRTERERILMGVGSFRRMVAR